MVEVVAYTDGGCRGNPGVGGWGMVLIHRSSLLALERAGGEPETTNNRMEMTGAIEAMRSLQRPGVQLLICTDSRYLIDCCTKWIVGWKAQGWARKGGPLKNVDLLKQLDELVVQHTVRWQWVAGHSGDDGNERADALANVAMDRLARGDPPTFDRRVQWSGRLP